MNLTEPYDPRALVELNESLETTCKITATTSAGVEIETLDPQSVVLTLDEGWHPHAQLEATVSSIDPRLLDPRRGTRLRVTLGYRYLAGPLDEHLAADLQITEWSGPREGTISLTAHGDELRLEKYASLGYSHTHPVGTKIVDILTVELTRALGRVPLILTTSAATISEPLPINSSSQMWDIVKALADQADLWVYADALGQWRITQRPEATGASVVQVTTGAAGITKAIEEGMTLDRFGNTVILTYTDGQSAFATRTVGPFGTDEVGVVVQRVSTSAPWPGSVAAEEAANVLLRLVITRGDEEALTGLAAWWVRPGATISTPTTERVIASRVRFTYPDSLMTLTTRKASS